MIASTVIFGLLTAFLIFMLLRVTRQRDRLQARVDAMGEGEQLFRALSSEALERNNQSFLQLAEATLAKHHEKSKGEFEKKEEKIDSLFKPVKEALGKLGDGMNALEKERKQDSAVVKEQLKSLAEAEKELAKETHQLKRALKSPMVRGKWGELQLKRVVELAGMVDRVDFYEQHQVEGQMRPDMVVRLAGDRYIVIDAKTPFDAYLEAMETEDQDERNRKLQTHTRHLRSHIMALGKKGYWEQFESTPEFVILFLPSEHFFSAALEQDPTLIEMGVDHNVILATPTTMIGLLRAISYGWKQENLSKHAKEISEIGSELYKRISDLSVHFSKLGRSLDAGVEAYNKMVGSMESRVLVTARKFKQLGVAPEQSQPSPITPIEKLTRSTQSPELD